MHFFSNNDFLNNTIKDKPLEDFNNYYSNELIKEVLPLNNTINSIFGPSGVGKTTFSYLLIKEELLNNKKIIYIDTEKSFSKKRFLEVFPDFNNKNYKENFFKFDINEFEELNDFLRKIRLNSHLIIIDSLSMPYRLRLKDDFELINKELALTLNVLLRKLDHNSKILLINHSYYWDNEFKIIGGDLIKYYSKVLISMYFENGERKLELIKHKFLPRKSFYFKITKEGLRKKGFFSI